MTNKELFAQMIIDFCKGTSCNKCKAKETCNKIDGGFDFDVEDIVNKMDKERIMTNKEAFNILKTVWELAKNSVHYNHLTSYEKMKVDRLLDILEDIVEMFE